MCYQSTPLPIKTCNHCGAVGTMRTFADNETCCDKCLHVIPTDTRQVRAEWYKQQKEIAALRAENAELRKDEERLDYIQANARCEPKMDGQHVWWPLSWNQCQKIKGGTIREAIDAAIDAEKET